MNSTDFLMQSTNNETYFLQGDRTAQCFYERRHTESAGSKEGLLSVVKIMVCRMLEPGRSQ